jgi:hypothetical protein
MYQIYLNSPPGLLSFILPPPWVLEQFQQVSFLHLLTWVYIICATSNLPVGTLPCPASRQNLFQTPVLPFHRRKNIKDNKKNKNMVFLLIWDKDSYTGRFLVLFLCTHACANWFISTSPLYYSLGSFPQWPQPV